MVAADMATTAVDGADGGGGAYPRQLCEDTSQFLNWRFSSSRLAEIRQANHSVSYERALVNIDRENELATAAAAAVNSGQQRQLSRPSPDTFTVYDSQTLVNYYAFVTRETALKVCQLPDSVVATAVTFFKRFFLHNTPIDYMPRNVSMTCIYLAIKAEMSLMSIDEFVAKVPKLKPAQIIDIEMEVSQSLQFEYTVHHPLRPLYGYFLDMQEFVSEIEVITSTYEKARTMIFNSLISDACFIYQPSQIALAAIQMASSETGFAFIDYLVSRVEDEVERTALLAILADVAALLIENSSPPSKDEAEKATAKHKECRNPAKIPNSLLFKQIQSQNVRTLADDDSDDELEDNQSSSTNETGGNDVFGGDSVKRRRLF